MPKESAVINISDEEQDVTTSIDQVKKRFHDLQRFIQECMQPGQDYAVNSDGKLTLLKPGAERLLNYYGYTTEAHVTHRLEDWENGLFSYEVKVSLRNRITGEIEAEGFGICNSRERQYLKQDPHSLPNTLLKMARKRALTDATLTASGSSFAFTQDYHKANATTHSQVQGLQQAGPLNNPNAHNGNGKKATAEQLKMIYSLTEEMGISADHAREMLKIGYQVKNSRELSRTQADGFIKRLLALKKVSK